MVVRQSGLTLLEVLVSLQVLTVALLALLPLVQLSTAALAVVPTASAPGPARLRTLATRYLEAELEYLRSLGYVRFRSSRCRMSGPPPLSELRRVPGDDLDGEPRLPREFFAAEVEVADEPVAGSVPDGCGPRRIVVRLYRTEEDAERGNAFAHATLLLARR